MPVGVKGLDKAVSGEMKFVGEDLCDPLERRPGEDAVGDVGWVDGQGLVNEELRGDVKIFS